MTENKLVPSKQLLLNLFHDLKALNPHYQLWLAFSDLSRDEPTPFASAWIETYEYNFDELKCPEHFSYDPERHLFLVDGQELVYLRTLKDNN